VKPKEEHLSDPDLPDEDEIEEPTEYHGVDTEGDVQDTGVTDG